METKGLFMDKPLHSAYASQGMDTTHTQRERKRERWRESQKKRKNEPVREPLIRSSLLSPLGGGDNNDDTNKIQHSSLSS